MSKLDPNFTEEELAKIFDEFHNNCDVVDNKDMRRDTNTKMKNAIEDIIRELRFEKFYRYPTFD